jgi:phosphatidylglycerol lysyltransferase
METTTLDSGWPITALRQHGYNAMSSLLLYDHMERYRLPETVGSGFVGYVEVPSLVVALGEPVTPVERYPDALQDFASFAASRGKHCAFIMVGEAFAAAAREAGGCVIPIGEDFIFDVPTYAPRGDRARKVRWASNQARRNGVVVHEYDPKEARDRAIEAEIDRVGARWLRGRRGPLHPHILGLYPFAHHEVKRYFWAERAGRAVAFLVCAPIFARDGYLFEDLVRDKACPNGATELLVLEALSRFRDEGRRMATFGLSPRIDFTGAVGLPKSAPRLVALIAPVCEYMLRLSKLHHYRKKFGTQRVEACYLVKMPRPLRAADVYGLLRAASALG